MPSHWPSGLLPHVRTWPCVPLLLLLFQFQPLTFFFLLLKQSNSVEQTLKSWSQRVCVLNSVPVPLSAWTKITYFFGQPSGFCFAQSRRAPFLVSYHDLPVPTNPHPPALSVSCTPAIHELLAAAPHFGALLRPHVHTAQAWYLHGCMGNPLNLSCMFVLAAAWRMHSSSWCLHATEAQYVR